MKQTLLIAVTILLFAACRTSKDFLSRSTEDRTLFDVIKTLNKKSTDTNAIKALPIVYDQVKQIHLNRIASYKSATDLGRWDKIINEYETLQSMYDAIMASAPASLLVIADNYQNDIYENRELAAADYYQLGNSLLQSGDKADAKLAYSYFKKTDALVPGYKEAKSKMNEAYRSAIINVVINPIQDNSFFNASWGNYGYNYSNQYFQQTLVRELGGKYSSQYPADFYTDVEARSDNVEVDWVIDLTLRNMDLPRPSVSNNTRNVSAQVQDGKDTSGKPRYKTVYATINIARRYFTARAQMDVNITDAYRRKNISYTTYTASYDWQDERATYTGDSRALTNQDWALINNKNYISDPRREDVLNELYKKLYPQVKNRITYTVDW
ncbi:hypothetical protein [Ferruginibacter sp.]